MGDTVRGRRRAGDQFDLQYVGWQTFTFTLKVSITSNPAGLPQLVNAAKPLLIPDP